ncbi:MAG: WG repeat-containing protein [Microcystaceae cyanobacterium]
MERRLVIPYQFDYADDFSEGLAFVKKDETWMIINTRGNVAASLDLDIDGHNKFHGGLAIIAVKSNHENKARLINTQGQVIIPFEFDNISPATIKKYLETYNPFPEIKILMFFKNTKREIGNWNMGLINTKTQQIIPCEFDSIMMLTEKVAIIKKEGKQGIIDINGHFLFPLTDCKFIQNNDNYWNFYENDKKLLLQDRIMIFQNNLAGLIDLDGNWILPCQFSWQMCIFSKDKIILQKEDKCGVMDLDGQIFIDFDQYDHISPLSDGLAAVKKGEKCGFINEDGELVIPCQYDGAFEFKEGLAWVKINDEDHLIDRNGEIVM